MVFSDFCSMVLAPILQASLPQQHPAPLPIARFAEGPPQEEPVFLWRFKNKSVAY
jgi:hypothetical protein